MIDYLLTKLGKGQYIELLLNVLLFSDFRKWTNPKNMNEIICVAQDIIDPGKE